jgi:hypothetical protein
MSHSEDYSDTGRTRVFYDGMQAGIQKERERIVELLRNLRSASKKANLSGTANINAIIGLIKGGQE